MGGGQVERGRGKEIEREMISELWVKGADNSISARQIRGEAGEVCVWGVMVGGVTTPLESSPSGSLTDAALPRGPESLRGLFGLSCLC